MSIVDDAALIAALFAVDPAGLGGVCIHSGVHPARDQWLQLLRDCLPAAAPLRRIPCNIADGRLLGGLNLVATLKANRPIAEQGVLAATDGGVVVVAMAERLSPHTAACINSVLDSGEIAVARDGVFVEAVARVGIVALDEGISEDEGVPNSLRDRLAFHLDLTPFSVRALLIAPYDREELDTARELLPRIEISEALSSALAGTALALGVDSPRVTILAARAAKAAAALAGQPAVREEDAVLAGRLVLAPRATRLPAPAPAQTPAESQPSEAPAQSSAEPQPAPESEPPPPSESHTPDTSAADNDANAGTGHDSDAGPVDAADDRHSVEVDVRDLEELVLAATQAAIPPGLLAQLKRAGVGRTPTRSATGKAGAWRKAGQRGRPAGVRAGAPAGDARLNVLETLRAAAPWQRLRGRSEAATGAAGASRVRVEPADFRVTRYKQRSQTLTVFVVDASGSSALNRLAEAKGAVELLLADCYIRRDQVAVIAFRGRSADVLLPPTRSLVRAKRSLAGLPGGGGTPLAAGMQSALLLAGQAQRRGETPTLVFLTDGRANVSLKGVGGRGAAQIDALTAGRALRLARITSLLVDTSPKPSPLAQELAAAMNAQYVPLPFANARSLSAIVRVSQQP